MTIDEMLEVCYKYGLCIEQVFLLYLLSQGRTEKFSPLMKYIKACDKFDRSMMDQLVTKGFLDDFNSPGKSYPEYFMLTGKAKVIFADEDMGEELWEAYPAAFPIEGGKNFIARAGGDKNFIITEYLKRIGYSTSKHKEVMKQLAKYKRLVARGIINGYKISDFVKQELWNVIAEFDDEGEDGFGRDL